MFKKAHARFTGVIALSAVYKGWRVFWRIRRGFMELG